MTLQIAIDRGGTFTDVWYKNKETGSTGTVKLLSEDPANYKDAPFEAIRRIIEKEIKISQPVGTKIDLKHIDWIRMGTTVATNALLERQGEKCALVITEGFKDLLYIGNQSRPDIFDLKIQMPEMLYTQVVEVEERVVLPNKKCKIPNLGTVDYGRNGEEVLIRTPLNESRLLRDLQSVKSSGIDSIAVVLAHSYIYPKHEERVGKLAENLGFSQVSLSSHVMPMIKMVSRGYTSSADAYLTPCIKRYLHGFASGFTGLESNQGKILFMQSDGGLTRMEEFMGSRAILSGPAGGVVGYARTTFDVCGGKPVVGFDMGGTSTDVSRYAGNYEHVFESITAGISLQAAQLDINTVAAGGGSRLFVRDGGSMLIVGPESAGAHPGPVSYRKAGGKLAITDANLVLGRLLEWRFPRIFGPDENQELDKSSAVNAMTELLKQSPQLKHLSVEELALGFIKVANESMCRPIRALTQARGYDTSRHVLACFGGAGGQHACAVARSLGMPRVFIHKHAGILSAFGLALADVVVEQQEPCASGTVTLSQDHYTSAVLPRFLRLIASVKGQLHSQGFLNPSTQYRIEAFLNLRYHGTDCALMISTGSNVSADNIAGALSNFHQGFLQRYKSEFGFVLSDREILVDDIRVRGSGLSGIDLSVDEASAVRPPEANHIVQIAPDEQVQVYYDQGWLRTPVYDLSQLLPGIVSLGPAIIIDRNCTILVEPDCKFQINNNGDVEIDIEQNLLKQQITSKFDPIQLSIFSHRFMSIAEQMGKALQRTSVSTNIKERLDFSCALFGPDGGLVANAPHIPVHLGAMQYTVQYQLNQLSNQIQPGDVLLSNHPLTGGSHLPDLTVITPVYNPKLLNHQSTKTSHPPIFFLANRGHHADIGGSTPGSMPPGSQSIFEEGAVFRSFFLVKNGVFQEQNVIDALKFPAQYKGCSGARNISDNLSDLRAQVAANEKGKNLVLDLIDEYSLEVVQAYMAHIQNNAELSVRNMLREIAKKKLEQEQQVGRDVVQLHSFDFMDTGSRIELTITIDIKQGSAHFDFTGTGPETITNLNTPKAVTQSCLIYCLRCLVGHDVPLNQGCLKPITLKIPPQSILSASDNAAVVGGNVQTSQRIVDVILRAFESCAASQGCMNNLTFGDNEHGYYETISGGTGAGPSWHGRSGVHSHMTNTRITDLEIIESRYPVVLEKFALRSNSGGQGQFIGGNGVERSLIFRSDMTVSLLTERRVFEPYGMSGGMPGSRGQNLLVKGYIDNGREPTCGDKQSRVIDVGAKISLNVQPGDMICILTPGGGGYGKAEDDTSNQDWGNESGVACSIIRGSVFDYQQQQFSV